MATQSPKNKTSFTSKLLRSPKRFGNKSKVEESTGDTTNGLSRPLQLLNESATEKLALVKSYVAVVAIDFGTTYSGCAYAFTRDPSNIHLLSQYSRRTSGVQQPTVLLLTGNGDFHSFGYEAQEYYRDIDIDDAYEWLYFEKFKMELHSRQVCAKLKHKC